MARGDPTYFQVDVDIFPNGERFSSLSAAEGFLYLALWGLAVRCRTDVLPRDISTDKWVAEWVHKCPKSVHRWMDKLSQVCLITRNPNGTLTIHSVRKRHKKLRWDKVPQMIKTGTSPTPSNGGRDREIESMRDPESGMSSCISTDPDSENVTQKEQLAPPGPTGAVVVKNLLREAEQEAERKRAEAAGGNGDSPDDLEPWNQSTAESELELEVHRWFLELWSDGEYDWDAEKDSVLSQVRIYNRGSYNTARAILLEHRREGKFIPNELAYLNGIARKQWEKSRERG